MQACRLLPVPLRELRSAWHWPLLAAVLITREHQQGPALWSEAFQVALKAKRTDEISFALVLMAVATKLCSRIFYLLDNTALSVRSICSHANSSRDMILSFICRRVGLRVYLGSAFGR